MLKTVQPCSTDIYDAKRKARAKLNEKRAQSLSPIKPPTKTLNQKKCERRCHSVSSTVNYNEKKPPQQFVPPPPPTPPRVALEQPSHQSANGIEKKDSMLPQSVLSKMMRTLGTRKREFNKLRSSVTIQQNSLLESYAQVRELEVRANVPVEDSAEVRIVSVSGWPPHDLLILVRDDLDKTLYQEISSTLGANTLYQMAEQLSHIPEDVAKVLAELKTRRLDLLNMARLRVRGERSSVLAVTLSKKAAELDAETEKLHGMVASTTENVKAKVTYALQLAKVAWIDRDTLVKKLERVQKEMFVLQNKLEEALSREKEKQDTAGQEKGQALNAELAKERAAQVTLKDVVASAESMLRVARARISTLERQLKDTKAEYDLSKKKYQDLEQLYRNREMNFDARSKKLLEVSKTGEFAIETLTRQRDALELRVKELHDQIMASEQIAHEREVEQQNYYKTLKLKLDEQEKAILASEAREMALNAKYKETEAALASLREHCNKLLDEERTRCLDYVPSKEPQPTDRETELWLELQRTKATLANTEEELQLAKADKDNFLDSLSRIAQDGSDSIQEKTATELLNREQKIAKLQHAIEKQKEKEKEMLQTIIQYEDQIAALRLDVKRLRNYESYSKEVPYQELQNELIELNLQVEKMTRERAALVTAAASHALVLERHERSAELFARMIRARRNLAAELEGRITPPPMDEVNQAEVSRSLSSICTTAGETWSALHTERARVLRLESALLSQSLQLERGEQVRTVLEKHRTMLEREVLRAHNAAAANTTGLLQIKPPRLLQGLLKKALGPDHS